MRSLCLFLIITLFCFMPLLSYAKNQVVYFEPKSVKLNGVIRVLKFPGAPNYENIKDGDADETGGYLILNRSIDINLKSQIGNDKPVKNIKLIQLVVHNANDWKKIKEGNYVQVVGTLFSALTGHHHARILIRVNRINILSARKIMNRKLNISDEDWRFLKYQHLQ